jgi:hypothetical protein
MRKKSFRQFLNEPTWRVIEGESTTRQESPQAKCGGMGIDSETLPLRRDRSVDFTMLHSRACDTVVFLSLSRQKEGFESPRER